MNRNASAGLRRIIAARTASSTRARRHIRRAVPEVCLGCACQLPQVFDVAACRRQLLELRDHRPHVTEWLPRKTAYFARRAANGSFDYACSFGQQWDSWVASFISRRENRTQVSGTRGRPNRHRASRARECLARYSWLRSSRCCHP